MDISGHTLPAEGSKLPPTAPTRMDGWVRDINRLVGGKPTRQRRSAAALPAASAASAASAAPTTEPLWLADGSPAAGGVRYRFSAQTADALVRGGLRPELIDSLARASHLQLGEMHRYTGLDRTTLKRRADKGEPLPEEAAVRVLTATELVGQATQVFGSVEDAAAWLTTAHPMLDDETPMQRARTPWGLAKVQEVLVALRYGGVA